MAGWKIMCNEFKEVREMINNDADSVLILDSLEKICDKYASQHWDFAEEFEDLAMEIDLVIQD